MLPKGLNSLNVVVMTLVFGFIMAMWMAGVILWIRQRTWRSRHIDRRLGLEDPALSERRVLRLWKDGQETRTTVPAIHRPVFERIEDLCRQAGWSMSAPAFVFSALGFSTLLFAAVLLFAGVWLALGAVAIGLGILQFWMRRCIAQRLNLFEAQLIEALELAARSLRAGHPLSGSFRLIAEEIRPPVSTVFAEICQRQSMGVPLDDALRSAAGHCASPDLNLFATSVIIQIRTGGNLANMIDRLAAVIRDRRRLNARIRVLTAQTQLSKRILIAMPIILFFLLNLVNPAYMDPLYHSYEGRIMLAVSAVGVITGAWVMNRMAVLRY